MVPDGGADFAVFFAEHRDAVVRLAYALCGDGQVAEEVAQETFLRAYVRWDDGGLSNPAGWVRTVAVNLARSRLRRVGAELRALGRLGAGRVPAAEVRLPGEVEAFWGVVRQLPRRQAVAVALHYGEDRSIAEVAGLMGCAENTVKVHLHRARRRLQQRLSAAPTRQKVREDGS